MYFLLYTIILEYHKEANRMSEDDTAIHGAIGGECLCNTENGKRSSGSMDDRRSDPGDPCDLYS